MRKDNKTVNHPTYGEVGKRFVDITGKVFGRLTVIRMVGKNKRSVYVWECLCECGKVRNVIKANLNNGHTNSCGCYGQYKANLAKESKRITNLGKTSFNRVFRYYVTNANRRGIDFKIDRDFFKEVSSKNCFYCNKPPSDFFKRDLRSGKFIYNGVDRVDNNRGYEYDNCVSCCRVCNRAKGDLSIEDWMDYLRNLTNFRKSI